MSFSLFNRSFPFVDLVESQLKSLQDAAALLDSIFGGCPDVAGNCRRIRVLASETEAAGDEIMRQLALTFLKPDERNDIHQLNVALQEAMLTVKNASTRAGLYGCTARNGAKSLTGILLEMLAECADLIANLAAARPDAERRQKMRRLKEEAQALLLVCLGETYESEPQTPVAVLEVIKRGQIYDRLEESIVSAARIATIVEGISLKNV